MLLKPGTFLSVSIEKPAAGGRMIARADGQVVLVSGAIPGERARIRIERVARGVAYGETVDIESVSPDRREPAGDPLCGGTLYAHIEYARQLAIKSQVIGDALGRIARVAWPQPIEVAASREDGYRMRARLHARGGRVGFFREGSHATCDARQTRQLMDSTSDVMDAIGHTLADAGADVRVELELSENLDGTNRVVHFESEHELAPSILARIARIDGLTGVTASRPYAGSAHIALVSGDAHVYDVLDLAAEVRLRRHVLAFFQGNRYLLRDLIEHVLTQIDGAETVLDLYAGVGVFAVPAAVARRQSVVAVEGDAVASMDLTANAAAAAGLVQAIHRPVEAFLAGARAADAIIVDPPRTGMSKDALEGVLRLRAPRVVYVSCDVATFARDLRRLIDSGYELQRLRGFDLFPNTPHVETVAVLAR